MQKKIIWVFGESATGKRTLINNIYNNDLDTLYTFNMNGMKICVSDITLEDRNSDYDFSEDINVYNDSIMEEDNSYFKKERALQRRSGIMIDVENFLKSDSDVLLIKGQVNDMNIKRGNIVGNFLNKYYGIENIDIEVFLLKVNDEEELKKRIASKDWFKEITDKSEKEEYLKTIPSKQDLHKEEVINAFSNYEIPIYQIESNNNSYKLDGVINRKNIRK